MSNGRVWVRTQQNQLVRGDAIDRIRLSDDQRELLADARGGLTDLPVATYPHPPDTEAMMRDQQTLVDLITEVSMDGGKSRIVFAEIIDGRAEWRVFST